MKMNELKNLKNEIIEGMNDYSIDFVNCYDLDSYGYISDAIIEFADSNTSVYYSDQREFYYNNTELCENALIDFGYNLNDLLKEGCTLDDLICKAGAIGEYIQIENTINYELEDIIKLMIINYIIDNDINCNIDILDNIDIYKLDRLSEVIDLIEEYTKEDEEEEETKKWRGKQL